MTARRPKVRSLDELTDPAPPTAPAPTETEEETRARREAARGDPGRSRADLEERQRRWFAERDRIERRHRPALPSDPATDARGEAASSGG